MSKQTAKQICLALSFAVSIWSNDALACQDVFAVGLDPGQSVKTPILQSPNGQRSAWSEATMEKEPVVLHSKVLLANKSTGRRDVILQSSRNAKGYLIASDKKGEDHFCDGFCVIDWSADSRYLLIERMQGPLGSDAVWFETSIYDTKTSRKYMVNLSVLRREVENYWSRKRIPTNGYHLTPVGWGAEKIYRIVFTGFSANPGPDAIFLGVWSISLEGRNPRLLAEEEKNYQVKRLGILDGETSWFPKRSQ